MNVPSVNKFCHGDHVELMKDGEVAFRGRILMIIARCILHQTLHFKMETEDKKYMNVRTIQKFGSNKFIRQWRK